MDNRLEIDENEFNELLRDVECTSLPVKCTPVEGDTKAKSKNVEIEEEEFDELLRDVNWDEDTDHCTPIKSIISQPKSKHLEVLKKHFGHAKFRPMQWEIIYNIIESKCDGCVIMATGYGKSLCYQFPPVFCNGTALVITPLISLMEDQTLALEAANIPACYLGAGQSGQGAKIDGLMNGDYNVVYLTPEFCTGDAGQSLFDRLLTSQKITLVAIDEAHCVSQWGHDFRHSYRKLGKIRDKLGPSIPILALTATATEQVQDDICSSLKLRNPFRICSGFDRPNLYLAVHQKGLSIISDLRRHMVGSPEMGFGGPTIIYCPTKKTTENVARTLQDNGVNCRYYHAELSPKLRKEVHHLFVRDEIQVIVATVAFGMGIDKPDVRLIIHYGAPKDMESYYQEVGRAGRDGLQSHCHCFYATSDFNTNQYFLGNLTGRAYEHRKQGMLKMEQYLNSRQCRRQFLLSHFEPQKPKASNVPAENCCDNCTFKCTNGNRQPEVAGLNEDGTYDFSEDTQLLLSAANYFGGRFGITMIITFLCGGKSEKFRQAELKEEVYGKGKHKTKEWWKGLGRMLLQEGYLEEVAGKFNFPGRFPVRTIKVGARGLDFLRRTSEGKITSVNLYPSGDILNILKKGQRKVQLSVPSNWNETIILPLFPTSTQSENSCKKEPQRSKEEEGKEGKLYAELLKLRNELAKQHSYMPYMVANNKTLLDVAAIRPSDRSDLALVEGFNAAKIDKFGAAILQRVQEFCNEHGLALKKLPSSNITEPTAAQQKQSSGMDFNELFTSLPETVQISYHLFQVQGKDLASVAKERDFKESTIGSHLADAVRAGLPLDAERFGLTEGIRETIFKAIRSPPVNSDISRLKPIKDNCPNYINYEQIKITVAMLAHKHGIKDNSLNLNTPDLSNFKYNPAKKKPLSNSSVSETCMKESKICAIECPREQKIGKRSVDLRQFVQKNFKEEHANNARCSFPMSQEKVQDVQLRQSVPTNDNSGLWEDDDIFECVDMLDESVAKIKKEEESNISCRVDSSSQPEATQRIFGRSDVKRKPKELQQEMRKKMKTNSLFRK